MRYKDSLVSANEDTSVGRYSIEPIRRRQKRTDDYEFLENYDFISHLEESGFLKQYRETSYQREATEEIHINLEFMEDPSFYHEVEYFDKLNKTLEKELVELDGKMATPPSAGKKPASHTNGRTWKVQILVAICGLLATVLLLGGGYIYSGIFNNEEDAYAFDGLDRTTSTLQPVDIEGQPEAVKNVNAPDVKVTNAPEGLVTDQTSAGKQKDEPNTRTSTNSVVNKVESQPFKDTVFIGNSLVVGLKQTCDIDGASFYACQSLDINDALEKAFVVDKNKTSKLTILEALSKRQFNRIYLMFGINELGWPYSEVFIDKYQELIRQIKKLQPSAALYVQSILPVTKSCSENKPVFSKKNVMERNKMLQKMSAAMKVNYLDVYNSLCNEEGYLPENNSTDGIHLRKTSYNKWLDYLKISISKK